MFLRNFLREWLTRREGTSAKTVDRAHISHILLNTYGVRVIEDDPKGNARHWTISELTLLNETLNLLGPAFYEPFAQNLLHVWIDRAPGGGSYGNQWLRIGEPGGDLSVLYRIFLHEGTHASNEYRGWPYETQFCMRPGLDWTRKGDQWIHPRQQGRPFHPGNWETLPVDSRDVSTSPGEDLAESVRYFVHSVKNERAWLWPLDLSKAPVFLWDTSPTRFVYVRDYFLVLPQNHPWYKRLSPEAEHQAAQNLAAQRPDPPRPRRSDPA